MDFIVNDKSIHEQFHDSNDLQRALEQLYKMRQVAQKFGCRIRCTHLIHQCKPMPNIELSPAISQISNPNLKRAILSWLNKDGPFWEDDPEHSGNDWLELKDGSIVTDTGIGEAAFRVLHGGNCGLITVCPSDWMYAPIQVVWRRSDGASDSMCASVDNWWLPRTFEDDLTRMESPTDSWHELSRSSKVRFGNLTFFEDSFSPLLGLPFSKSSADKIQALLNILNALVSTHNTDGIRTAEGHRIYRDYFTGGRAWFSDSSASKKRQFQEELKFSDQNLQIYRLSCTWHGKINYTTPIRMHFSWPIKAGEPLYIVYIGPKKTMR